ncbi:MAG: hypothetical protein RJS97_02650 [Parvibaculaceae bacterium]
MPIYMHLGSVATGQFWVCPNIGDMGSRDCDRGRTGMVVPSLTTD